MVEAARAAQSRIARLPCPRELVDKVCEWVPLVEFLRAWTATCARYSLEWYTERVFDCVVVVPDEIASINVAINRLAKEGAGFGKGLVLVRPGIYAESVRVTQNCHIVGLGPPDKVIIEAPGWESALVSAGLGGRFVPSLLGWESLASGEDACVENVTFRCRNESMRGRCVYIVMGRLLLLRCRVDGGVVVSGSCTKPLLVRCSIRGSRGSGVRLTDHCGARLLGNCVAHHGQHGVLVDRQASPELVRNDIRRNAACGIRVFHGAQAPPRHAFSDNCFEGNGGPEMCLLPQRTREEEEESDEDEMQMEIVEE